MRLTRPCLLWRCVRARRSSELAATAQASFSLSIQPPLRFFQQLNPPPQCSPSASYVSWLTEPCSAGPSRHHAVAAEYHNARRAAPSPHRRPSAMTSHRSRQHRTAAASAPPPLRRSGRAARSATATPRRPKSAASRAAPPSSSSRYGPTIRPSISTHAVSRRSGGKQRMTRD